MSDLISKSPQRIEVSDHALADLDEIWTHFSEKSEQAAEKVLKEITDKFSKLLKFQRIGKERNELFIGLRSFPTGKYVIFYQETDYGIEIVRVAHGSRDIQKSFDEMIPLEP
jgi:toxin ParE1/3/4